MDRLPQDLYDPISTYIVSSDDREALLTVSRSWQATLERQNFRNVTAKSTSGLRKLREIFSRTDRRRYLKVLTYNIVLPPYQEEQRVQFEEAEDRELNNDAFTTALEELFTYLGEWSDVETSGISFVLGDIYSLSDHEASKISSPFLYMPRATFETVRSPSYHHRWQITPAVKHTLDLLNWRHRYSHLQLLRLDKLPEVPIIHSFSTAPLRTREVNDVVSLEIATKLPNLEKLNIRMVNVDKKYIAHWRGLRRQFAQAIEHKLPKCRKLQTLEIWTSEKSQWLPEFAEAGSNPSDCGPDALSTAIHTATTRLPDLRHLKVSGYVDASLLRPISTSSINIPPYWQKLETLVVDFETRRPRGKPFLFDKHQTAIEMPPDTDFPPGHSDDIFRPQDEEELRVFAARETSARSTFTIVKRSLGIRSRRDTPTTLEERFVASRKIEFVSYFRPYRALPWYPHKSEKDTKPAEELIDTFGHVCCELPNLKAAALHTTRYVRKGRKPDERTWNESEVRAIPWGVWYLGPGISKIDGVADADLPFADVKGFDLHTKYGRVIWETGNRKPEPDVINLFASIGHERFGRSAVTMSRWWT